MKRSSLNILNLTIKDLSKHISSGEISPVDLIDATLERITRLNPKLNAFITVLEKSARQDAENAELLIKQGKYRGPLHGIPICLKDLIYMKGVRSTSGSKILSDFVPDYDSTVVKKLKYAGAIIVGMNNTHEFACGITNINPHYGSSRNPWDISRMSGGSSGGSAVAVCAGMTPASIGTDTSGSIRVPSSLCGLFGLKPTYGRVSKYGVQELAPSIDHVGPIARSTWDIAAVLQTVAGYDKLDSSTLDMPVPDYINILSDRQGREDKGSNNFKVGIPTPFFFDIIDSKVMNVFEKFVDKLHGCGISTDPVHVQQTDKIIDSWRAIRLGESAAVHNEWIKSRRGDYGDNVIVMLEKGMEITAIQYITAHKIRKEIRTAFLKAMTDYHALLVPTTIIPAPLLDQTTVNINKKDTIEVYDALSRLTTVFDITGLPAMNIPAGFIVEEKRNKLPIGVQLVGKPFDEETLLRISHVYDEYYGVSEEMIPPLGQE
ncbi:MAG TPA: amidase [Nitrososphaeraceae archaeon]|nr:amidase [Nitrososphaeraceae archaeon]